MAQARSLAEPAAVRVQVVAPAALGATAVAALRDRGIDAELGDGAATTDLVALALEAPPTAAAALELAATCARAAALGRPTCVLAPPPRGTGRAAIERSAALAYLRAHGAVVGHDVDAWLEAIVALVRFGLPHGPRVAVIAPPGSWLEAQTLAYVGDAEASGARVPQLAGEHRAKGEPADVVLFDPELTPAPAQLPGAAIAMHVTGRGELARGEPTLYGMRFALGAIEMLGRAAERIAAGVGAATAADEAELEVDRKTLDVRLAKIRELGLVRVGDHETKGLLKAYGVAITRQTVETTPSAAVHSARSKLGFPVELKPWGNDILTELEGCPVERNLTSDALVRRAFTSVLVAAGKPPNGANSFVIVREPPPLGRDVSARVERLPSLGWTVVLVVNGQVAAAPAPLRALDAQVLASAVIASRAADSEPDRAGLAELLRRASHLAVDLDTRLERLELPRIVVGGRGARTVVVDAWCELAE
ncbi:MAG: acetate--CoA ligase family protein [Deltaproteobacteria bacterium]